MFSKKKIYLDYAGATPIDRTILKKLYFYEKKFFANGSAIYNDGIKVRSIIEKERGKIAKLINAHSNEIIFTGSGTESNAIAIIGAVLYFKNKNNILPHIITTKIEHPAVLENCNMLEKTNQAEVTYLSVDKNGLINIKELRESIKENTVIVSIMYANNEIGSVEPIQEVAKEVRYFRKKNNSIYPLFHTDACQAINYLYIENIEKLGVDLMSFNSSKIYGPKGIGALYKKRGVNLSPIYHGGGQEFGYRSGTESLSLITGFAEAFVIANKIKEKESDRLTKIRDLFIKELISLEIESFKIIINGGLENRLPNNINISILGINSELLVIELGALEVYVSEKSACHSNLANSSHVLLAILGEENQDLKKYGSVRISLGRYTKEKDVYLFIKRLKKILLKYKNIYKLE